MAEYLAPGVYVEETSFRAKFIESVGTSTTGFVGPTRTGPVGGTPELITSLGDFERIYGGLSDLAFEVNYVAHAVRNYFTEGGTRLYVSRVFLAASDADPGSAAVALLPGATAAEQVRFVARFPGSGGNGQIIAIQVATAATVRSMENAPEGSMLSSGGTNPPRAASMQGGIPPFSVPNGGQLALTVNGTDGAITFRGAAAEVVATDPLDDDVTLAADTTLQVTISGLQQTITLAAGTVARDAFVSQINAQLRGGYARLSATNQLVIGSDRRGTLSSVSVTATPAAAFLPTGTATNTADANNNVGDLARVSADEINALLIAAGIGTRVALVPDTGRILLNTVSTGAVASLLVRAVPDSIVSNALGLAAGAPATGADGAAITYYVKDGTTWHDINGTALNLAGLQPFEAPGGNAALLTLTLIAQDADEKQLTYEGLGFDPRHPRHAGTVLAAQPTRRMETLENPYALEIGTGVSPFELRAALFAVSERRTIHMNGGNDGVMPTQARYEAALAELTQVEDIAIVATPGASAYADFQGIMGALITHAEQRRAYRIAVLDARPGQAISEVRELRSRIDSRYAALYYPWVVVSNPLARPGVDTIPRELTLPPSGFICGIYARNDIQRGVFKAPANEIVRSALRFETDINFAQQEVLNPLGINCLRFFAGRGYRVWGARTASSDPEFNYVSTRRYFNYIEHSIDRSTQWAVFEPNGERLWANITDTVSSFLYNEWVNGALLGRSPKEAFFVRCDRSTMTQQDLDSGRLICLIGIAVIKPAEFVIFRIGQKTADARS